MSDFQVVLGDLRRMADTFGSEGERYRAITPKITPPIADGGDGALNGAMQGVIELIGVLHEQMAKSIADHHDKLSYAHDSYQRRDIDNRALFDDVMKGAE